MNNKLAVIDNVDQMLAVADGIHEILDIRDMAKGAQVVAKARNDFEKAQRAKLAQIKAERAAGEWLYENVSAGNPQLFHDETIRQLPEGVDRIESHRWQTMWLYPVEKFNEWVDDCLARGREIYSTALYAIAKNHIIKGKRAELAELGKDAELSDDVKISLGDFRDILAALPDNSIDMIFTDPPYDENSIPLYGDLARLAAQKMKVGASLITYAGHYAIGQIYNLMAEHLRYWWIIADKHNGNSARLPGKWVMVEWKPLLWFVKERRGNNEYVSDLFESKMPDKLEHDWQQDTSEAEYYIEQLTNPGDLVVDPFAGSGTTLLAAKRLSRRALGIEIDLENVNVAKHRLQTES